jgi:hypothetical protein
MIVSQIHNKIESQCKKFFKNYYENIFNKQIMLEQKFGRFKILFYSKSASGYIDMLCNKLNYGMTQSIKHCFSYKFLIDIVFICKLFEMFYTS